MGQNQSRPSPSGCPIKHDASGACPIKQQGRNSKPVYNVYGEEIDPTNLMPSNPNQNANVDQKYPLHTHRVASNIPKSGLDDDTTWTYPSEQMFFNAMKRKGKGDDVHEGHVPTIVAIHNNMNERTWKQVLHWEHTLYPGSTPRLRRFLGRPNDLTPLARVKSWLGSGVPFDRHDWFIERDDGTEVRYVIDYYYDEAKSQDDTMPTLHSAESIKSISMSARPAIDTVRSAWDRVRYHTTTTTTTTATTAATAATAPTLSTTLGKEEESPSLAGDEGNGPAPVAASHTSLSLEHVNGKFEKVKSKCQKSFQELHECQDEISCHKAATALQMCLGRVVCPMEAQNFTKALESGNEDNITAMYDAMNACIEHFETSAHAALRQQAVEAATVESSSAKASAA